MNYVISIINPNGQRILADICKRLELPVVLTLYGHGTATPGMLELLGLDSSDKRVVMCIADDDQLSQLTAEHRRRLYIDAPGNGILMSIPVKSVGGGKTLQYLGGHKSKAPELSFDYEMILAVANVGHTEEVMEAARAAGARGGTILHAKGANSERAEKFFKVSIVNEKEIVLIVATAAKKAAIMSSILATAGPSSPAGSIVFSLPVSSVAGFPLAEGSVPAKES